MVIIKASFVEVYIYALPIIMYIQSVGSEDNSRDNC